MILGRHSPDLEGGHCGYQNRALEVGSGVSAFVVCFACILSFVSFSLSVRSSVSLLCLFYTMLPRLAYCYLCAISLIPVLDLCSLVPCSRSATCFMQSLCYLRAIDGLSCLGVSFALCYLCAIDGLSCLGMFFALCYLCAICVLSMVFHAGGCFFALCYLCAISVLTLCYFCYLMLSHCYLCTISVLFIKHLGSYIVQTQA